jgi:hypothetical protein
MWKWEGFWHSKRKGVCENDGYLLLETRESTLTRRPSAPLSVWSKYLRAPWQEHCLITHLTRAYRLSPAAEIHSRSRTSVECLLYSVCKLGTQIVRTHFVLPFTRTKDHPRILNPISLRHFRRTSVDKRRGQLSGSRSRLRLAWFTPHGYANPPLQVRLLLEYRQQVVGRKAGDPRVVRVLAVAGGAVGRVLAEGALVTATQLVVVHVRDARVEGDVEAGRLLGVPSAAGVPPLQPLEGGGRNTSILHLSIFVFLLFSQ